jgi:RNA polymerase sigma factor (sigma-70 family)
MRLPSLGLGRATPRSDDLSLNLSPARPQPLSVDARDLVAARAGDPRAFEALVSRHQTALYNFSLRMLASRDDAADVAQETFIQLYHNLDRLSEDEPLSPWLFRVARNRCIDIIRRRRTVPLTAPDDTEDPPGFEPVDQDPLPDELVERADLQQMLQAAIAHLPTASAEVVALRYAADRSFAEIAEILGCDEGTARVRFHRAKAQLRKLLHEAAPDA